LDQIEEEAWLAREGHREARPRCTGRPGREPAPSVQQRAEAQFSTPKQIHMRKGQGRIQSGFQPGSLCFLFDMCKE
jgi:hypothetical protein